MVSYICTQYYSSLMNTIVIYTGTWQENYCPRECKMAAKAYTGFFESRSNSNSVN